MEQKVTKPTTNNARLLETIVLNWSRGLLSLPSNSAIRESVQYECQTQYINYTYDYALTV